MTPSATHGFAGDGAADPGAVGPTTVAAPAQTRASAALVARLFHRALAAVFLIAWLSLSGQILLLVGSAGLLPLADFVSAARAQDALSFWTFPSVLAWAPNDGLLRGGAWGGVVLAALAFFNVGWGIPAGARRRAYAAVQTLWYLGYVVACRSFLGFQWDNLLLECGLLAAFLPSDGPAPVAHLLFRALLFKLYFESGLAKWQSPLHDWRDGSAMTFYYQTAPLPTALAWYAHHLPRAWHMFESRATLAIELILPFALFGPRRARRAAAALFTGFQVINAATANYGFFCYLTVALHLFLLDDQDIQILVAWFRRCGVAARAMIPLRLLAGVRRTAGRGSDVTTAAREGPAHVRGQAARGPAAHGHAHARVVALRRGCAWAGAAAWLFVSATQALFQFGDPGPQARVLIPVLEWSQTFRLINTFHLFAAVTRDRIEPEFQIQDRPHGTWTPFHLRYKAGPLDRAPPLVAPHQPRVDFLLWFYGLGFDRRPPGYVTALLAHLCEDPAPVTPLFLSPPPLRPAAVRVVFWDYRFTSPAARAATGAWWSRTQLAAAPAMACNLSSDGPRVSPR